MKKKDKQPKAQQIFDDDEEEDEEVDAGSSKVRRNAAPHPVPINTTHPATLPHASQLRVNKAYATKFEATKKRQELTQLGRWHGANLSGTGSSSGSEGSSSETEDEDGEELTPALEMQILQTINSIRAKDPKIYRQDVSWFEEGEDEDEDEDEEGGRGSKRKTYKDVVREQVLAAAEAGREVIGDSDEEEEEGGGGRNGGEPVSSQRMAYDAEQQQLRRAFLDAGEEEDEEEEEEEEGTTGEGFEGSGLLTLRKRKANEDAALDRQIAAEVEKMVKTGNKKGGKEDEADLFLRDFILGKKWKEQEEEDENDEEEEDGRDAVGDVDHGEAGHYKPHHTVTGEVVDDEEDAEEVEQMEHFESKYNFRFEQEGGTEIVSYGRHVEGSARRKDDKRKKEREAYKKRKEKSDER